MWRDSVHCPAAGGAPYQLLRCLKVEGNISPTPPPSASALSISSQNKMLLYQEMNKMCQSGTNLTEILNTTEKGNYQSVTFLRDAFIFEIPTACLAFHTAVKV